MEHYITQRVLFVIPSLQCGGAERVLVRIANYLAGRNFQITIVKLDAEAHGSFFALDSRVLVVSLDVLGQKGLFRSLRETCRAIATLRKIVRDNQITTVLSFVAGASILCAVTFGLWKIPGVSWFSSEHANPYCLRTIPRLLRRVGLYFSDKIVVITKSSYQREVAVYGAKKVLYIPNPLDRFESVNVKRDFSLSIPVSIVSAGRLHYHKGFDLLIQAFAKVKATISDAVLTIYGEGEDRVVLEKQIAALSLEGAVFLPGAVNDLAARIARADLFVCSSRHEGFSLVLAEATLSRVPAISFNCPDGPREILSQDALVEEGNVEMLLQKMCTVLSEYTATQREQIAERNLIWAKMRVDSCAEYEQLLAGQKVH